MISLSIGVLFCLGFANISKAGTDEDALNLADSAPVVLQRAGDWKIASEAGIGRTYQRYGLADVDALRLSLDAYYDAIISPGWRLVFSDRIDRTNRSGEGANTTINTLKETYISWHPKGNTIVDVGRINARYGVAYGYNPTDFFRSGALRSVTSIDPNSLRDNRLGTAMLRGQTLLTGSSITAIYAPKLVSTPNNASFNADLGATNNRNRWLLSGSNQFSENINPQLLLFGGSGQSVQAGANLSALLNQSTVGYVEWSGGSSRLLYSDAIGTSGQKSFRQRVSVGLTYTNAHKLSLTSEVQYNGAGLGKNEWLALAKTAGPNYLRYRAKAQDLLELPTKASLFFYANWQDAIMAQLDLKAMVRLNLADQSRLNWVEARYHFTKVDIALQLQNNSGNLFTEWGSLPQRKIIQTTLTYFY